MHELVVNLHMHTHYSDGHCSHPEIVKAALKCGLDVVIVTDHNVWVQGPEDYYRDGGRKVLLLVGEEIHDQSRSPQKNHLIVLGANRELAPLAYDPQFLLDSVRKAEGFAFIAHPVDPASPAVNEGDLSWVDWDLRGFSGIELWNGMSEFQPDRSWPIPGSTSQVGRFAQRGKAYGRHWRVRRACPASSPGTHPQDLIPL
jgi:PHP domain